MLREWLTKEISKSINNIPELRRLLHEHREYSEISSVVNATYNNATLLIRGAYYGCFTFVKELIEYYQADLERVGAIITPDTSIVIKGVTPLWCAAAMGRLNIVNYLLERGANVNAATTNTNSTPISVACSNGHFEIVKCLVTHKSDAEIPNYYGLTCLMIACRQGHLEIAQYLIDSAGVNVHTKCTVDDTTMTALHECAKSGSLEIMKLLLDRGEAEEINVFDSSYATTPLLLTASIARHAHIVKYLISRNDLPISQAEKIEALELLGATFVDRAARGGRAKARKFWKMAAAGEEEKEEEVKNLNLHEMYLRALRVREKILGTAHPITSHYIIRRGFYYAKKGNFTKSIFMFKWALDIVEQEEKNETLLRVFVELFATMINGGLEVNFCDIMSVFKRSTRNINNNTFAIIMYFIYLLTRLEPILTSQEKFDMQKAVHELVRQNPRGWGGFTPLHLSCSLDVNIEYDTLTKFPRIDYPFPSWRVVNLLLKVGANPNATDSEGNTPLHILAVNNNNDIETNLKMRKRHKNISRRLLSAGAHLEALNNSGESVSSLALLPSRRLINNPLPYTSLQNLAAASLKKHHIYYREVLDSRLVEFVDNH